MQNVNLLSPLNHDSTISKVTGYGLDELG